MAHPASERQLRGWSRRQWVAGAALFILGCLSPTMPMPPPAKPTIDGPDASGTVVLSGAIRLANYVYVDNQSTGYGAGQVLNPETGAYRFSIQASVGDSMQMYYRRDGELSQARYFEIPEPTDSTDATGGAGGAGGTDGGSTSASTDGGSTSALTVGGSSGSSS